MDVGTRVKIVAKQSSWNRAMSAEPHVGLTGIVSEESTTPVGKVCVEFDAWKLGYEGDEPIRLFIETNTLEAWSLLDEFVRRAMLTHPSIYPNRARVLTHCYLTLGNGVDWQEDGTLSLDNYDEVMDYSDLDERLERWHPEAMKDREAGKPLKPYMIDMLAQAEADIVKERAKRAETARNIYELASKRATDFRFVYDKVKSFTADNVEETHGGHYEEAKNIVGYIESGYLTIANMPDRVEQSFFMGALDLIEAVVRSQPDGDPHAVTLKDFATLLTKTHTTYDGGAPKAREPVVVPASDGPPTISLRESDPGGHVCVLANGTEVRRFSEYQRAALYAQRTYNLSDAELMAIYHDYREDYDA
jgi:hypothetical protein